MVKCAICNQTDCDNKTNNIKNCKDVKKFPIGTLNKKFLKKYDGNLSYKFKNFIMRNSHNAFILVPVGRSSYKLYYKSTGLRAEHWELQAVQLNIYQQEW